MKILHYLILIRFRKIISKGDNLAIGLILILYLFIAYLINENYQKIKPYSYLLFLDVFIYHINRTDIDFLKIKKHYKRLILCEYLIYTAAYFFILFVNQDESKAILIFFLLVVLIYMPGIKLKHISIPFDSFDPFWIINFRKYKLLFIYPVIAFLSYISNKYQNENINYFCLILIGFISCSPSFERERLTFIKVSIFRPSKYLQKQLFASINNTFLLLSPLIFLFCIELKWEILMLTPLVFLFSISNVLFKYTFYDNVFLQKISFTAYITLGFMMFGISIITLPFLYRKAIKNLKIIKYAHH